MSYVPMCKVCNSKHKGIIEELGAKGLSAEKIYEYLLHMPSAEDQRITEEEHIQPSSIRRHLQKHFDQREDFLINDAVIKSKVKKNRDDYQKGMKINIDKANTLSHMIELALTRLEEVEALSEAKKHQYTIGYMGQIKGLIDELNKVSGSIKEEGAIDSNFFRNEINTFAEIVLGTIRALDIKYEMDFQLEKDFTQEFKKQYQLYVDRQNMIFEGRLSPNDGAKERNINKFNDDDNLV